MVHWLVRCKNARPNGQELLCKSWVRQRAVQKVLDTYIPTQESEALISVWPKQQDATPHNLSYVYTKQMVFRELLPKTDDRILIL